MLGTHESWGVFQNHVMLQPPAFPHTSQVTIGTKPCRFAKCLCVRACLRLCVQTEDEIEAGADDEEVKEDTSGPDFNYLLSMPMWFLTKEKKEELCRQRDAKVCILKGSDGPFVLS